MKIKTTMNQMEEIEGLDPSYPYTLHKVDLDHTTIPWHWHEELEFIFIVKGELKIHTSSCSYSFHENEGFFINTNVLCSLENITHCSIESHLFHSILLSGHFKSIFETKYLNPVLQNKKLEIVEFRGHTENQKKILKNLKEMSVLDSKENTEFQMRTLLSEIWLLMLEEIRTMEMKKTPSNSISQERLMTMMSYIQENYTQKLTLNDIAQSASLSTRECLRYFKNGIHESPFEYLINYRIEQAKKMLRLTNLPVTDIAFETGFSNGAYFSKIFKRECGKTPGNYRMSEKKST